MLQKELDLTASFAANRLSICLRCTQKQVLTRSLCDLKHCLNLVRTQTRRQCSSDTLKQTTAGTLLPAANTSHYSPHSTYPSGTQHNAYSLASSASSHILPPTYKPSRQLFLVLSLILRFILHRQYTIYAHPRISLLAVPISLNILHVIPEKTLTPQIRCERDVTHSRTPAHRNQRHHNDE